MNQKERLLELDLAKGIAIFLVVLGHLAPGDAPVGNGWYGVLTGLVYMFHMPLFMFLSGAVFFKSYPSTQTWSAYRIYLSKRALRLLPGFVLFAAAIWLSKEAARGFLHVDNLSSGGLAAIKQILLRPGESTARSLWFIYVLVQLCIFFPLLLCAARNNLWAVTAVAAALHIFSMLSPVSSLFAFDQFCEYALYFAIGILYIRHRDYCWRLASDNVLFFTTAFAVSFLASVSLNYLHAKLIIGMLSIPATLAVCSCIHSLNDRRILFFLSEYTFTIYLMNTLAIGAVKGALLRLVPWNGPGFLLHFNILLAAGILIPVGIHRMILSRVRVLGRITK